jgi:hypothetical protein
MHGLPCSEILNLSVYSTIRFILVAILMKKIVLTDFADYNFILIGISSHDEDYRVCWHLNKLLSVDFNRMADIDILHPKSGQESTFPLFQFISRQEDPMDNQELPLSEKEELIADEMDITYQLIANRHAAGNLIPEQSKMDYFLMIKGEAAYHYIVDDLLKQIRSLPCVMAAFKIEPESLKSKDNLIF